ncbi:uncharacterized protein EV420DRAFT_1487970 [Desarmillaria tabescens]|uniref:Uncharacterized protein n=1 Tax=Armillaria tabescens TaxID=1929756 RepID=A0AA39MHX0_ARMTA|nr:uncharacterized protein EV420DRAFT_1487970 [Desarmillaria tabescens]KAK0435466.1 hypothetical protein EV420DRAFT_1487970 [Desarmillaria tabescens]
MHQKRVFNWEGKNIIAWKEKLVPNGTPIHFLADDEGTFTSSTGLESFSMRYPCYACLESRYVLPLAVEGIPSEVTLMGAKTILTAELRVLKLWKEERKSLMTLSDVASRLHPKGQTAAMDCRVTELRVDEMGSRGRHVKSGWGCSREMRDICLLSTHPRLVLEGSLDSEGLFQYNVRVRDTGKAE